MNLTLAVYWRNTDKFKEAKIDEDKYKLICDEITKTRTSINGFKRSHLIVLTSNDEEI